MERQASQEEGEEHQEPQGEEAVGGHQAFREMEGVEGLQASQVAEEEVEVPPGFQGAEEEAGLQEFQGAEVEAGLQEFLEEEVGVVHPEHQGVGVEEVGPQGVVGVGGLQGFPGAEVVHRCLAGLSACSAHPALQPAPSPAQHSLSSPPELQGSP